MTKKNPPCDLPMVSSSCHWQQKQVQGFLVTVGKNGTSGTIDRFAEFTIEKTPNVAYLAYIKVGCKGYLFHGYVFF